MRLSDFYNKIGEKQPKQKRLLFSTIDKNGDDFHLIPVPVIAFYNVEALFSIAIGIKCGFWGIGLRIILFVKNKWAEKLFSSVVL